MDLLVFDLDGTLLNGAAKISAYTRETLDHLSRQNILYTVATGRMLHGAREVLQGHPFALPQIFKNGVVIWDPDTRDYTHQNFLTLTEIQHVLEATMAQGVTPFLFTVEPHNKHGIYHPPLQTDAERQLVEDFRKRSHVNVHPAAQMPATADISNISALGAPAAINTIDAMISREPQLVAYSGRALEGEGLNWIDIHHIQASKGNAVEVLRAELNVSNVICFGDSDNDLSMFAVADEAYAPANAKTEVKAAATGVLEHNNDDDAVARYLRIRFRLAE